MLLNLCVTRPRFFFARARIQVNRVPPPRAAARSHAPPATGSIPGASCQRKFLFHNLRIRSQRLLPVQFNEQPHRRLQILKALLAGLALSVRVWHFKARRPLAPFFRAAFMNHRGQLMHDE